MENAYLLINAIRCPVRVIPCDCPPGLEIVQLLEPVGDPDKRTADEPTPYLNAGRFVAAVWDGKGRDPTTGRRVLHIHDPWMLPPPLA
jgi:hypothetical protein